MGHQNRISEERERERENENYGDSCLDLVYLLVTDVVKPYLNVDTVETYFTAIPRYHIFDK